MRTKFFYFRAFVCIASLLPLATFAESPPPPVINPVGTTDNSPAALGPDASIDDVLDALQNRGQTLKEFTADVKHTETATTFATTKSRTGKVWLQIKPDGDTRLRVLFDKKSVGDKPPQDERKEYLLNDGWLTDRDYKTKTEVRRQVAKPGEKVNLFQLGKGPFPLPIGQDRKDVHALFEVTKIPPAKDDPSGAGILQLTPKPNTEFERKFKTVDVWVDPKTKMPVRIETLSRDQSTDQQTDLENLKVNEKPGLSDADFTLPPIDDSGWNRHDEAMQ